MGKGVFARFPAVTPPADDAARTGDNAPTGTSPSSAERRARSIASRMQS